MNCTYWKQSNQCRCHSSHSCSYIGKWKIQGCWCTVHCCRSYDCRVNTHPHLNTSSNVLILNLHVVLQRQLGRCFHYSFTVKIFFRSFVVFKVWQNEGWHSCSSCLAITLRAMLAHVIICKLGLKMPSNRIWLISNNSNSRCQGPIRFERKESTG